VLSEVTVMKLAALLVILLTVVIVEGCAGCESCKNIPGWDGRYATHDRGALNRENRSGLPVTPYEPR
jgi:hypothetical protein